MLEKMFFCLILIKWNAAIQKYAITVPKLLVDIP